MKNLNLFMIIITMATEYILLICMHTKHNIKYMAAGSHRTWMPPFACDSRTHDITVVHNVIVNVSAVLISDPLQAFHETCCFCPAWNLSKCVFCLHILMNFTRNHFTIIYLFIIREQFISFKLIINLQSCTGLESDLLVLKLFRHQLWLIPINPYFECLVKIWLN